VSVAELIKGKMCVVCFIVQGVFGSAAGIQMANGPFAVNGDVAGALECNGDVHAGKQGNFFCTLHICSHQGDFTHWFERLQLNTS
jgi:hypothetical protein